MADRQDKTFQFVIWAGICVGLVGLVAMAFASSAWAGPLADCQGALNHAVTLECAIARALSSNPQIVEGQSAERESKFALAGAQKSYFPVLSAELDYDKTDDVRTQLPDSNQAIVRLDENVFQGGQRWQRIRQLEHLHNSAYDLTKQKNLETIFFVKQTFYEGLAAAEQILV